MVRGTRKGTGGETGAVRRILQGSSTQAGVRAQATCGRWPWGSWGRSQEYSSSRSTLTIMASVCVKLLTKPESRPVRDRA